MKKILLSVLLCTSFYCQAQQVIPVKQEKTYIFVFTESQIQGIAYGLKKSTAEYSVIDNALNLIQTQYNNQPKFDTVVPKNDSVKAKPATIKKKK